jgi:hypothetical protein
MMPPDYRALRPDFRALCKELADDLALWAESERAPSDLPVEQSNTFRLLTKAYKALMETRQTPGGGGTDS